MTFASLQSTATHDESSSQDDGSRRGLRHVGEPALVQRAVNHDARAWSELERRIRPAAMQSIRAVTRRFRAIDSDTVLDIYAELLGQLLEKDMAKLRVHDTERGRNLRSWISMLARNMAWDHLRRRRGKSSAEIESILDELTSDDDPHNLLAQKESWQCVWEALETLPSADQLFVRLFYLEGRSPEEVARTMRTTVNTVYCRKRRVRSRLSRALRPADHPKALPSADLVTCD